MRRLLFLGCAALALAGCAETIQAPPSPPDPRTQMAALAGRIEALVEEERLKLDPGAKALVLDPELTKVALARARDMAEKNYLAHAAPNGDTSASLLMADDAAWQGLLGENLAAQHYVKVSGVDVEVFAQRFLDEWIKSDPHRENLAYPAYDRTGVGAAVNGDTVYVAELFASDLGLKNSPQEAPGARPDTRATPP
ncbi:MAG TPA: CAP domain-containing protein [Rhizomicrobium sp.]|nr:CAP domain-containing protein [Rhizomicrobium sp.]